MTNATKNSNSAKGMDRTLPEGFAEERPLPGRIQKIIGLLSASTTRKGIIALADQIIASTTNFFTGVIIGRACIKEEFGLYMLGFTIMWLVIDLQGSLISSPYTVYSPRFKGTIHQLYTGSTLSHQLVLSALVMVALAFGATVLNLSTVRQDLEPILWALVGVIAFITLKEFVRRLCFADLRMMAALVLDSCVAILQIGILLFLAHYHLLSAMHAFWAIGFSYGIVSLTWLISSRKAFIFRRKRVIADFALNWAFGRWVFSGDTVLSVSQRLYPWFLAFFRGTAATGIFAACWGTVSLVNPLLLGIGNYLGPKTVRAYAKGVGEIRQLVFKGAIFLTGAMFLFCLFMVAFGGRFTALIYGNEYAGNGVAVMLLALSLAASATAWPASYALWAMERPDINFKVNLIALVVALTLGVWMVKSFGLLGIGYGLLVGNTLASATRYIAFARLVRSIAERKVQ